MDIYLDSADMPDELYRHLFLSFIKRPSTSTAPGDGEPSAAGGGRPNGDVGGPTGSLEGGTHESSPSRLHGLAGKLHELTERLHNLGGSVAPPGRRHRAGTKPEALLSTCVPTPAARAFHNRLTWTFELSTSRFSATAVHCMCTKFGV